MTTPINQAALFAALDVEAADALRASMMEIQARRGEVFFEQGEPGDRMFVIMQGKITLAMSQLGWQKPCWIWQTSSAP
jgi:CRP-like cAMP-binding protein